MFWDLRNPVKHCLPCGDEVGEGLFLEVGVGEVQHHQHLQRPLAALEVVDIKG